MFELGLFAKNTLFYQIHGGTYMYLFDQHVVVSMIIRDAQQCHYEKDNLCHMVGLWAFYYMFLVMLLM